MGLGAMLKARMGELGVTQAEAAAALGVTATTLSRWVRDKDAPRLARIQPVADWLGVPIGDVVREIHNAAADVAGNQRIEELISLVLEQQQALRAEIAELRSALPQSTRARS